MNNIQSLIDECELKSSIDGETYFIFDRSTSIKIRPNVNKSEKRDNIIEDLFEEEDYHVGDITGFDRLPSRFSYYDTETKSTDRYKRYNIVVDFIKNIGFESSESNFGPEFEQSYNMNIQDQTFNIRLRPNLHLSLILFNYNEGGTSGGSWVITIYKGFFNKDKIYTSFYKNIKDKSFLRDLKMNTLEI